MLSSTTASQERMLDSQEATSFTELSQGAALHGYNQPVGKLLSNSVYPRYEGFSGTENAPGR